MQLVIVVIVGCFIRRSQKLLNGVFDQQGIAKDTHNHDNWPTKFEVVFNNYDQAIGDDCKMYLYSDSVLRFSPKRLDTQMLLNPLEEQFNLPSVAVKKGNVFGFKVKVTGKIYVNVLPRSGAK